MMPLCFICLCFCVAIHLMDGIHVIVSCMIIREPMSFLKPLHRDCERHGVICPYRNA